MPSSRSPEFLVTLPGELRNHIYTHCILSSLKTPKTYSLQFTSIPDNVPADPRSALKITAFPRWSGPGRLRLEGIGALPILFVNKQVHKEVLSLLYSMIQNVSIGGYVLQYPGEDPGPRWECAYTLLKGRPDLLQFVPQVTVMLPYVREGVFRGQWSDLYMKDPGIRVQSRPWQMVPGLVTFLQTFKSLTTLKVIITADGNEPPDFEELLGLYDICGHGTAIEVVAQHSVASWAARASPWASTWTNAWAEVLIKNGRI
jgi:hypothetical protein